MSPQFDFTPPSTGERSLLTIGHVSAIALFRAATRATLQESRHFLLQNLGGGDYNPIHVGYLIQAYYSYKGKGA